MTCCINCFVDKELKGFILSNSTFEGDCDSCKTKNASLIDVRELEEYFQPIIELFRTVAALQITVPFPKLLSEKLQESWNIFNLPTNNAIDILLKEIFADTMDRADPLFTEPVEIEVLFTGAIPGDVHEKKWENFAEEIKTKNRFFLDETIDLRLLADLFKNFARSYDKGKIFYRARICATDGLDLLVMGKPPAESTTPGRANPKGIPYLYLSTKIETTIYECRSNYLDYVSVAEFKAIDIIKVVSLRAITAISPFVFGDQLSNYITHQKYLARLEKELSKPIRGFDKELDYLPSQYLCEYVKSLGYDAVEYGSSFKTDGINLAVFNDSKLEGKSVETYEIVDINLTFKKLP